MKKFFLVTLGLVMTFGVVGCKSKKEKTWTEQLEIAKIMASKMKIPHEVMINEIIGGRDLQSGEISRLDLSSRNLTILPPEIGLLTGLEELDLRKNQLSELPKEIGNLKKLKKLNVAINTLTKLPDGIGSLESLEELDVSENKLTELPETIGNLGNLNQLWLFKNTLTDLPFTMVKLTKISHIAPQDNPFKVFPKVLGLMPSLSSIMLSPGFDTTTIPPNVRLETGGTYVVTH